MSCICGYRVSSKMPSLDLLSTSQKMESVSDNLVADIEFEFEQSRAIQAPRCDNDAPYICFPTHSGVWCIVQGCCNSWLCARCGQIRARAEYGRIVEGVKTLAGKAHQLYFVTITCRGADLDLASSDDNYLKWTNRLLSVWRARCVREKGTWCYVQVTERQQRGAAHSHLITTHYPNDARTYRKGDRLPNGTIAKHDCLFSEWFMKRNVAAGLGKMTDCTTVRNPASVAVYVSKYLFKDAQVTLWPKGWKRVRYSQGWPKLPDQSNPNAFPVITLSDWYKVKNLGQNVRALDEQSFEASFVRRIDNVLPPKTHEHQLIFDTIGRIGV